ncbi:MAG: zinc transporter ZntB [Sphingomonadaceae bacterium]
MLEPCDDPEDLDGPMLFARVLDGTGGGRAISWKEAQDWQPAVSGEVLWMHLCRNRPGVAEWLEHGLGLPEPTAELLTSDATRPRAFREGNTLVATLRGINFNPGAEPEDMVSMQLWSDGTRLLTLRRLQLQTPRLTLADIDAGRGPVDAGALITSLVEHMIARMSSSIVDMNDHIDLLEEADPEDDPEGMLQKISEIRRNCLGLKRHMSPQHEALETISRQAPAWFEEHDRREIAETIDRLRRYLDDIDISKESAVVLQDDLRARSLASSEHATYMLTIVAGIFLPLGFLTGLLGINVGGMPGTENPEAFWVVVGLCCAVLALQLLLFWRWKWF